MNKEERKCMQHPGRIIDAKERVFVNEDPEQLKAEIVMKQMKKDKADQRNNEDKRYFYSCCQNGFESQGCQAFYHIERNQIGKITDELLKQRRTLQPKWDKILSFYK